MNELGSDLREVVVRLARQLRRQGDTAELSAGALSALSALNRHGPMTVGELARHEQVTPPMITKIARQLDERELVTRRDDEADGRVTHLVATAAGGALIDERGQAGASFVAERLGSCSPEERAQLEAVVPLLRRIAGCDLGPERHGTPTTSSRTSIKERS